ncbi:hypothetical protein E4U43_000195 [Claviceps pusilla]|uniref:CID domain-containing protein n=1 Tax=Claviceps pusilla TaxID=123648 RepID=A0A9P7SXV7_9HYPO|nr:hypothetical protein E4U43_000195 [Claviceps pusilla]
MAAEAEEVAEDYRHALEDLSSNMRFEISNLTVIARENTEHALAIADVLQQHILKVSPENSKPQTQAPPAKKLPSLYVLDSIVKNVGTPYTLYFGRNLFKIFMESYAVVDSTVRRKMEEMLRTWKDPVPGSMDTRPVFSHELVRPIENALMKARAATMPQQGPIPGRPRSAMMPHRNTPTPPGMRGPGAVPPGALPGVYPQPQYGFTNGGRPGEPVVYPGQPQVNSFPAAQQARAAQFVTRLTNGQFPIHSSTVHHHHHQVAAGSTPVSFQPPPAGPFGPGGGQVLPVGINVEKETLSNDIQNLIVAMKAEFTQNPHDASIQNRLRALLDLQGIVQRTSLPPDQLELIKNKVTELAAVTRKAPSAQKSVLVPGYMPPPHSASVVTPSPASFAPEKKPQVTLDSLLGPGAMAALMARQAAASQGTTSAAPTPPPAFTTATPTPTTRLTTPAIRSPPSSHAEAAKPPPPLPPQNPLALLDQLRQAGMLRSATPTNTSTLPAVHPPPVVSQPILPPNITSILASAKAAASQQGLGKVNHGSLNEAALKQQYRPEAIAALYDNLGPPCTQCGRRFRNDSEGKKKKMAHMDWHFRVHQRTTDSERRGTHRSWYVDHQDWLRSREVVDSDHVAAPEDGGKQTSEADEGPKYIAVPDPASGINTMCPICQEKFENKWLDTAQEWVWLDAVLVGNRAFHASCHAEATRDHESTPVFSRRTPEPVLGKRKAESNISSPKIRTLKTAV